MNAHEVGNKLVELINQKDYETIYGQYYSPDILSVEAGGEKREWKGMEEINAKNEWWMNAHEVHSEAVKGPYPHGEDHFALIFNMDITAKESGQRFQMEEVGVYKVQDGRIVEERFFYTM